MFEEFTSMNFSIYGQWLGIASIILLIVLGIVSFISHVVFSIIGFVFAVILVFAEVPLCTKFCPTSPKFDNFVSKFENTWFRAAMYLVFAIVMFLSNLLGGGLLNIPAVFLLLAALAYGLAAIKGQSFASSKILGGTGVDNVV